MIKYISQLKTRNLGKLTKSILKYYHIEYNNTMVLSSVVKNKIKIDINEDNFKIFFSKKSPTSMPSIGGGSMSHKPFVYL